MIVAVDGSVTSLDAGLKTLETRIDIRDQTARDLRAFLGQNGIAPPLARRPTLNPE